MNNTGLSISIDNESLDTNVSLENIALKDMTSLPKKSSTWSSETCLSSQPSILDSLPKTSPELVSLKSDDYLVSLHQSLYASNISTYGFTTEQMNDTELLQFLVEYISAIQNGYVSVDDCLSQYVYEKSKVILQDRLGNEPKSFEDLMSGINIHNDEFKRGKDEL